MANGVADGAIGVAEDQDFVAGVQGDGAEDGVAAGGGVVQEDDVAALGADEPAEIIGGGAQGGGKDGGHETGGLAFHLVLPVALCGCYGTRGGAEGTVVDGQEVGVEAPFGADRPAKRWGCEGEVPVGGWWVRWGAVTGDLARDPEAGKERRFLIGPLRLGHWRRTGGGGVRG